MNTIANSSLNHIKKLLMNSILLGIFALSIHSAFAQSRIDKPFTIRSPYKDSLILRLAISKAEHTKGLSGLRSNEFNENEGMLFINFEMAPRKFWMPNTYFNLDIIFIDQNFKIVGIESDVPSHIGFSEPPLIYRTKIYFAQYILELKSKSKFAKKLKISDQLIFNGPKTISEIKQDIHRLQ